MKKIVAILLFILSPQLWGDGILMAQKSKLDGLLPQLKNSNADDNSHVKLLNDIAYAYSFYQLDSAHAYADRAYAFAKNKKDKKQMADALINKMWTYSLDLRFDEIKKPLPETYSLCQQTDYTHGKAYCLCLQYYTTQNNNEKSALLNEALHLFEKINDAQGIAFAYNIMATLYLYQSPQLSKPYILTAIEKASLVNDSALMANNIQYYGSVFVRNNQYDSAYYYYKEALRLVESNGVSVLVASGYSYLAEYYTFISDYPQAVKCLLQSIRIAEFAGLKGGMGFPLSQIGTLYFDMNKYDVAKKYFQESIQLANESKNYPLLCFSQGYLGSVYLETNRYDSAYYWFTQSLSSAIQSNDSFSLGTAYLNLGDYYRAKKEYANAFVYFNKAIIIYEKVHENFSLGFIYFSYANVISNAADKELIAEGISPSSRYKVAKEYAQKAYTISRESNNPLITRDALRELHNIAEKQNNAELAYEYYKQYVTLKDSIMNKDNANSIATMQIEYDTEKKEQQIALLTKDTQLQQSQIQKQKTQRNGLIGGCALVLLLAGIIYNRYRVKQKANTEIEKTMQHLRDTQDKLIEREKLAHLGKLTADVAKELTTPVIRIKNLNITNRKLLALVTDKHANAQNVTELKNNLQEINTMGFNADKIVKRVLKESREVAK